MKLPQLRKSRRQGFTLIELLTVIAIIGILAGMLSVVVPLVKLKAAKMNASNNCQQIVLAYNSYASGSTVTKTISTSVASNVTQWATYLAQKTSINDARLWFIAEDDRLSSYQTFPTQIINTVTNAVDGTFASTTPKSWAVVANIPRNTSSTYPMIWTRGLTAGATTWSATSPWAGKGGHIGFMDGSVSWFDSTVDDSGKGIFVDYTSNQPTQSAVAAIGPNATVLEDQ